MSNLQQLAGPLPLIDIDSVRMERESFRARFVIKTEESLDVEPFWLNEDLFSEFIRFWFVISIKSTTSSHFETARWVNPMTRAALTNYPSDEMIYGRKGVAYESYSLKDLKERFKVDSDVQSNLGLQTLNKNEILFEIEFSLREMDQGGEVFFADFSGDDIEEVELITFSHLDAKEMQREFGVSVDQYGSLVEIGGNLVRLPLIRRRQLGFPYSQLEIATPIQSLFDSETGGLYEGEYHYHTSENPGANGYVGYMSGPSGHSMVNARTLNTRSVPNDKVTANFLTPDDARGLVFDWSSEAYYQDDFVGGTPPSYRSSIIQDPSVNEPSQLSKIQKADLLLRAIESRTKKNVFSEVYTGTGLLANKASQVTTFTINIDEVLKKSPYYGIYERLVGSKNVKSVYERLPENTDVLIQAIVDAGYSRAFAATAESIANYMGRDMEYHQVRIYRRRLQNQPTSNNILSTRDREKRSTEEIDELIGLGSMTPYTTTQPYELSFEATSQGVIVEIVTRELDKPVNRELTLRVHDAEMLSTINYGVYTYVVELNVMDSTKAFIKRIVDQFHEQILHVQGFLHNYASLKGNYLEPIDRYKQAFRNSTQFEDFTDQANRLINLYVLLNSIMYYSENNNITKPFVDDIKTRMTSTQNKASLKRSYEFLDKCVQLESVYKDFLEKNRDSALTGRNASQLSTNTTTFSAKSSGVNRSEPEFFVSFSQQLPSGFFVEAITDGQLMLDIGLENLFNINTSTPSSGDLTLTLGQGSTITSDLNSPSTQMQNAFNAGAGAFNNPGGNY